MNDWHFGNRHLGVEVPGAWPRRNDELARLVRLLDPGSLCLHTTSNTIYSVKKSDEPGKITVRALATVGLELATL